MISIGANKKNKSYGSLFVPEIGKTPSRKSSSSSSPTSDNLLEEITQIRDELAKRHRDQEDLLYNLNLENFSPEIRSRLEKLLGGNTIK